MTIFTKYIDPLTDFGFKHIFGREKHKKFLISFLNDLLDIKYKIVDLEYRNLEKLGLNIIDRKAVFDVYCTDEKGQKFIVELQRAKQKCFKDRSIYYTTFPIQEQSKRGDWDYRLEAVYFVGILEFTIDDKTEEYLREVKLYDVKNREVFYEKLTYYYIELPKFKKEEAELKNHLEYWLYFFNNLSSLKNEPEKLKKDEVIKEALDIAKFLALEEDEKFAYQLDMKSRLDYKNTIDYATETAFENGIEKGEQKAKIEIAKSMLKDKMPIEIIEKYSGLSKEEIEKLKKE